MFKESFKKLEPDKSYNLIQEILKEKHDFQVDADKTVILSQSLSFYPDCVLLDLQDFSQYPAKHIFLIRQEKKDSEQFTVLNWTNEPVFSLNTQVPVLINDKTIRSYIQFFFYFVYGEHGRFLLIDSVDDIIWREDPPVSARKSLAKLIEPMQLIQKKKQVYEFKASIIFKDTLFRCHITVEENGEIHISDEELLVEDIPVVDDILGE